MYDDGLSKVDPLSKPRLSTFVKRTLLVSFHQLEVALAMVEAWETPIVDLALVEVGVCHFQMSLGHSRTQISLVFVLAHSQEAMMEVLVEALEALETKVVDLEAKGLAGWEEVGAEEDMGLILET